MTRYAPIEDHGVIGDLRTVALVGLDGTIDSFCYPHFDSPSVFASLLDAEHGGSFRIWGELPDLRQRQFYLPDTNVLVTRHLGHQGVLEICDFMPIESREEDRGGALVRLVRCVRGRVRVRARMAPRFDYARAAHRLDLRGRRAIFHGEDFALRLLSSVDLEADGGDVVASCELAAGDEASFVLESADRGESPYCDGVGDVRNERIEEVFDRTVRFWRQWISRSHYRGRWREYVNRSALVLKLLQSAEHGSLIAAPTFGLPEKIGGSRNWDYRYAWVRDAAFTVSAFSQLGLHDEMHHFIEFLAERCAHQFDSAQQPLHVLYGVDGRVTGPEQVLDHLEGYRGSRPVRIGNAAAGQLQLDMYGELMNALFVYTRSGYEITHDLWKFVSAILGWLEEAWRRPDDGIWETRGEPRHFLQSKVMCWSAFDRGLKIAEAESLPAPRDAWYRERDAIYGEVFEHYWNQERGFLSQYPDGVSVDSSLFMLPLVDFLSPADPKWLGTMREIEHRMVEDSFVYRNLAEIPEELDVEEKSAEGSFCMCTFWWVQCLSEAGELERARLHFEKMLGSANHLGLYGEQLGRRLEHLGNFPQALTHLGLINAALDLDRRISREARRPGIRHQQPGLTGSVP